MANEQYIDQVVTPSAEAGVVSLTEKISDLNRQFIDTAKGVAALQSALGNTLNVRTLANDTAKVAQETEKLNGIQLRNQITQERLNQTIARGIQQQERQAAAVKKSADAAQKALSPYEQLNRTHIAARAAARDLAVQYGQLDARTIAATRTANGYETQLRNVDESLRQNQRNVGNYGSALAGIGKAYGFLRVAANIIPGLGISGILLAGYEGLRFVLEKIGVVSKETAKAVDTLSLSTDDYLKTLSSVTQAQSKAQSDGQSELLRAKLLYDATQNHTLSLKSRNAAYDELSSKYPKFFENSEREATLLGENITSYNELAKAILSAAAAKAYENAITENVTKNIADQTRVNELDKQSVQIQKDKKKAFDQYDAAIKAANKQFDPNDPNSPTFGLAEESKKGRNAIDEEYNGILGKRVGLLQAIAKRNKENDELAKLALASEVAANFKTGTELDDKGKRTGKTDAQLLEEDLKAYKKAQDLILENQQSSYSQRYEAVNEFEKKSNDRIKLAEKQRVISEKEADNKRLDVKLEDQKNRQKIQDDINKAADLAQKELFKLLQSGEKAQENEYIQAQNDRLKEIEDNKRRRQELLLNEYESGVIDSKRYNKELLDIETNASIARIDVQLGALKKVLAAQAGALALGYGSPEDAQKTADALAKLEIDRDNKVTDIKKNNAKDVEGAKRRLAELEKQLAGDVANFIITAVNATYETRAREIENERKISDERADNEKQAVDNSLDTASNKARRIAIIEAQNAARQKQLDKEARKLAHDKAVFDKEIAIGKIVINTAIGVSQALAEYPYPYDLVVAGIVGAIGALEIATVLAQPLPAFAKGVENFKGGLAWVGEEGREWIDTPTGSFLSPDTATLMNLPNGTDVTPHKKTMAMIRPENLSGYSNRETIQLDSRGIIKAIKQIPQPKPQRIGKQVADAISNSDYFRRRGE